MKYESPTIPHPPILDTRARCRLRARVAMGHLVCVDTQTSFCLFATSVGGHALTRKVSLREREGGTLRGSGS
jgi:hypothetical protein